MTQTEARSTSRMAPYAIRVTVRTDTLRMNPLVITCNSQVLSGNLDSDGEGMRGHPDGNTYRIDFDQTGFKAGQTINVVIMSPSPVRVTDVR